MSGVVGLDSVSLGPSVRAQGTLNRASQCLLSGNIFTTTTPCENPVRDALLFFVVNCGDWLALPVPTPSGVSSWCTEAEQLRMTFPTCPCSCDFGCNFSFISCTLLRLGFVTGLNIGGEIRREASILLARKMPEVKWF